MPQEKEMWPENHLLNLRVLHEFFHDPIVGVVVELCGSALVHLDGFAQDQNRQKYLEVKVVV